MGCNSNIVSMPDCQAKRVVREDGVWFDGRQINE